MKKQLLQWISLSIILLIGMAAKAQQKLSIEGVKTIYVRNTGQILDKEELKGYFTFYVSDKIDRHTNEYTIQITDNNLNKVKDIKFEDDKNIQVLESSYNGNTIMFLFYNEKERTLEYRAYGFDGKVKTTYTKELTRRSSMLLETTYHQGTDEGQNQALFSVGDVGYTTVFPVKEGRYFSYEVNFFYTSQNKHWTYEAAEEQDDKYASAQYLGATDSLVVFEVLKRKGTFSTTIHSALLGLNIFTGKKEFELSTEFDDYNFHPMNISSIKGKADFMVMGTYGDVKDKAVGGKTLGLAVYMMNSKGTITSKKYNSWENDFSKYLPTNSKGRIEKIGYLFFHRIIQTEDGKIFAIGEGYKKVADGVGIAMTILNRGRGNVTMMQTTDMLILQFDEKFDLKGVSTYEKHGNNIRLPYGTDFVSPHMLALMIKAYNGFDFDYTQTDNNHTRYTVGFDDFEKSDDYKGVTFRTITYADGKMTTDKINLSTKAKWLHVYPAKLGFVMIMEYYRKEKRLELHLEKIN